MQEPKEEHMDAARQVPIYMKGTLSNGILLRSDGDLQVHAFCDTGWGTCPITHQSLTGYLIIISKSLFS